MQLTLRCCRHHLKGLLFLQHILKVHVRQLGVIANCVELVLPFSDLVIDLLNLTFLAAGRRSPYLAQAAWETSHWSHPGPSPISLGRRFRGAKFRGRPGYPAPSSPARG